jgi:hypothetical protein
VPVATAVTRNLSIPITGGADGGSLPSARGARIARGGVRGAGGRSDERRPGQLSPSPPRGLAGPPSTREGIHVNPWWWVPIGLAAWLAVSIAAGLLIGRWLRGPNR